MTSGRLLPGLTVRRLLTATPAALPLNKTMSAEIADNAGMPQLRQFLMVSIKELLVLTRQSCNTRERALGSLPANRAFNSDQVISGASATAPVQRAPGPGLRGQAKVLKLQASSSKSLKLQAASIKPQAQRFKRQAASNKLLDLGPFKKFQAPLIKALC